jgi:hypothetical protein
MRRRSSSLIAMLASLGILAAGSAHGQVRTQPVWKSGGEVQVPADPASMLAAKLAELDSWLRALEGHFSLSVERHEIAGLPAMPGMAPEGVVDCSSIGAGPGVHCLLSIGPPHQRHRWESSVMLFGVDIDGPGIHLFRLNSESTAEAGVSPLRNNAVIFHVSCPVIQRYPRSLMEVLSCRRETRVHVRPDSKSVEIRQYTNEQVLMCGGRCRVVMLATHLEWALERVHPERPTGR